MLSFIRGIGLAAGVLVLASGEPAGAQENFDAGKTGAQLFASDCGICHKSPLGLAKGGGLFGLSAFLREHYTASQQSANVIAAYLQSLGNEPSPGKPKKAAKRSAKGEEKGKEKEKGKENLAKPGDAKPGDLKSGDGKPGDSKGGESKTGGGKENASAKPAAAKPSEAKSSDTKPSEAKSSGSKTSGPKTSGAKSGDAKPNVNAAKPKAETTSGAKPEKSD